MWCSAEQVCLADPEATISLRSQDQCDWTGVGEKCRVQLMLGQRPGGKVGVNVRLSRVDTVVGD